MGERHELLGQRAELTPQRLRLTVECEALRDRLRQLLPLHEDVEALSGEQIVNTAIALHTSLMERAAIQRKIDILTGQLGA